LNFADPPFIILWLNPKPIPIQRLDYCNRFSL
jgi:hypothetical protein